MKSVIVFGAFLVLLGMVGIRVGVFTTHQMPISGGVLGFGIVLVIVSALGRA